MFAMARARGGGGVLRGLTRPFSGLDPSAATVAIHAGEQQLDERTHASAPSLCLSTTFSVQEPLSFSANALAESDPWCYTRWANPTVRQLEHKLAALEGVAAGNAVAFASGMAASAAVAGGSSGPAAALLPRPPFRMWSFDYNATASGPD